MITARAIVGVVPFECRRAEILEESFFDRLVRLRLLKLILDGQLQVAEFVFSSAIVATVLALDVAGADAHVQIFDHTENIVLFE